MIIHIQKKSLLDTGADNACPLLRGFFNCLFLSNSAICNGMDWLTTSPFWGESCSIFIANLLGRSAVSKLSLYHLMEV